MWNQAPDPSQLLHTLDGILWILYKIWGYESTIESVQLDIIASLVAQKLQGEVQFESHSRVTVLWLAFHIAKH